MTGAEWLLPDGLSIGVCILLVTASVGASFLTAATGLGGGMALFAIMASVMPVAALIPVHGVVQIGSNAARMLLMLRQINWKIFSVFMLGSLAGIAIAAKIVLGLPEAYLKMALAGFILWSAWCKLPAFIVGRTAIAATGAFSSFLTMFFGATGVFVAAMLKGFRLDSISHLGTHAACMVAQHGLKVAAFGFLGFVYWPYLPLIVSMIASGTFGTILGRLVVIKMGSERFHHVLSIVLTVIAMHLLWGSLAPTVLASLKSNDCPSIADRFPAASSRSSC